MGIEDDIDTWQKEYLSPFCLEECLTTCCCRTETKVLMDQYQVRQALRIPGNKPIEEDSHLIIAGINKQGKLFYWVSIHPEEGYPYCPAYEPDTRKCRIEHDKPAMCKEYPMHLDDKVIQLSSKCYINRKENKVMKKLVEISQGYSRPLEILKGK